MQYMDCATVLMKPQEARSCWNLCSRSKNFHFPHILSSSPRSEFFRVRLLHRHWNLYVHEFGMFLYRTQETLHGPPDLNPWGYLKSAVFKRRLMNLLDLRQAIREEFSSYRWRTRRPGYLYRFDDISTAITGESITLWRGSASFAVITDNVMIAGDRIAVLGWWSVKLPATRQVRRRLSYIRYVLITTV